ncbi:MAG: nucleoside recognition protein [Bacteroidales bacterium]
MNLQQLFNRILKCIKPALPKAAKTTIWLLKITIPVTFLVLVLNYTGWLAQISSGLQPFFNLLGLPAESAFVLITSMLTNIYSVIAVISTLAIPVREATILAIMSLIAHGFIIESAIIKKSGSSVFRMLTIRVIFSLVAGLFLNAILPQGEVFVQDEITASSQSFPIVLKNWVVDMFFLGLKIISLVSILFIFQNILEEFGIIAWISCIMRPLMRILGLPESTSVSLIVVNTIGLAYGAAVVLDQLDKNKMIRKDADLLNHHAVISHSQIEDPLLFLALGITIHWLIWPRIILAILVVWLRKLELRLKKSRQGKVQLAYGSA